MQCASKRNMLKQPVVECLCSLHGPLPQTNALPLVLFLQNKVGGGEGLEGVYGSITRAGMTSVLETLQQHAQLNEDSIMLDIGSGLGR